MSMNEREWQEQLNKALIQQFGTKTLLTKKYQQAFATSYQEENTIDSALRDISKIELLTAEHPFEIDFYESSDPDEPPLRLRLFQYQNPIPLSDILPMLENLDLRTFEQHPYEITLDKKIKVWISDFSIVYQKTLSDPIQNIEPIFQDAFMQTRLGHNENDGFNKLVIGAKLTWREITILRAYAKYIHQIGFRFSQKYIEDTLASYPTLASELVNLFKTKFDPTKKPDATLIEKLTDLLCKQVDAIISLDEDRILRLFISAIKATLRTNYFQYKEYLSFKLNSKEILDIPLPIPLYEIFVYSTRFEGIHLRSDKVSRGGIRWSDRREDFRTEVLGLMKAQRVKNAVIVPSGAKGGFVLKNPSNQPVLNEVISCYKSFISGLLDITDNIKNGKIISPKNIVCYDDMDPYLVVAADKGTASFSDVANHLAKEYGFWLGDAFASGGSAGYDHKKIGITARGAWESIKRHFRELNLSINNDFTVVGIGDMSGDVFGNGMLYSKHIKLIAAFDHRHIFIDPQPDPLISFEERKRLFNLPGSSWADYNKNLISSGGGVYARSEKNIVLSKEAKEILGTSEIQVTPTALIRIILTAPVDLLYNGGIGTYVKASTEDNSTVGDKNNDFCRVNGNQLRCKIVGEGGNLGFTQLGRIEYALSGGLINTDFIDNSGGVDCSDHEVNLKILLNIEVEKNNLTEEKRNELLKEMTEEVAQLVLMDNFNQALVISFSAANALHYIDLYQEYMKELKDVGGLNPTIEFLPNTKQIAERKAGGFGLTKPELAILLAYTKIYLKQEILRSDILKDPYLSLAVESAFPKLIKKLFNASIHKHPLHREILATQLSNQIVNNMGITFVHRLQVETGASVAEIIRAYNIASKIFKTEELEKLIESFENVISLHLQNELLHHLRRLINLSTRWFLYGNRATGDLKKLISFYQEKIDLLEPNISNLMTGATKAYLTNLTEQFSIAGLSHELAVRIAGCRALYTSLNIIELAELNHLDLLATAKIYFRVGEQFNLVWFRDQIGNDTRTGHWHTLARLTLRDELDALQRALTVSIIQFNKKETDLNKLFSQWTTQHEKIIIRWNKLLEMLHSSSNIEYSMFFITIREFLSLVQFL